MKLFPGCLEEWIEKDEWASVFFVWYMTKSLTNEKRVDRLNKEEKVTKKYILPKLSDDIVVEIILNKDNLHVYTEHKGIREEKYPNLLLTIMSVMESHISKTIQDVEEDNTDEYEEKIKELGLKEIK